MKNIFPVYKPKGPTSNDIVVKIKKITGIKKVGHAGTLDPLASGVLVIGVGREATKKLDSIVEKEKEYIAKIKLGETSSTDDEEGEKSIKQKINKTKKQIERVTSQFVGSIKQVPPKFSAIKVSGQEAYKLARQGKALKLGPRDVEIKEIEIINYQWPYLALRVVTGPGVYIRSLARDIGEKLKTGGYLVDLERTRVGDFTKEKSMTIDEFKDYFLSRESID
ncbi:MAG: tRNA pseudouridine(55) synthase TruB [Candidatus Buchananbacteria bacterium RIFCSPHIGHO2_02_FULL_38_8]|uniref:tRNA pseudouridine synthase B n=2 Tax=Candidatus Buchananiibacteriota TaxID=1817903 RepID=A0A1G1Y1W2_9BACT|nr:MAG: tRNA pseudouridine(55) synthase TruB [Candidatus Buchananbacteria bacterium RIFCSPHIGHO2_01_FULL_39_8]OGY47256.1 MAG: tRNA pseudouridine(55) synthase TruB [Candidatus Buchananbacteria bacterium RIFCSPHIGHO2_02_FULL_38_8]